MKTELAERPSTKVAVETAGRPVEREPAPARKSRKIPALILVFAVLAVALLFQFANLAIIRLMPWASLLTPR